MDHLSDFGRKRGPRSFEAEALKTLEVVSKFCNVAVVDVSESLGDVRVKPIGSYC